MTTLSDFKGKKKKIKRVGRGDSSGMGKTSTRGHKGAKSRSGYKRRLTYEGGGLRLFKKLPKRGFTRGRFLKRVDTINLRELDRVYSDGESVNMESLRKHGLISGPSHGVKVLGTGEITKKVAGFEGMTFSATARAKIEKAGIKVEL